MQETVYLAILNKSEIIVRNSLNEIRGIPYLKYFFAYKKVSEIPLNAASHRNSYKFEIINGSGEPVSIKAGNFEIIDISSDEVSFHGFQGRDILVFDKIHNTVRKLRSDVKGHSFLTEELLPLTAAFEISNDWEIISRIFNYPKLIAKIDRLEKQLSVSGS